MKVKITYQALKAIFCLNLLFLLGSTQFLYAIEIPKSGIQFTENKGQWEAPFLFKADIPIGNLFIEKDQLTYLFVDKEATHEMQHGKKTDAIHFHSVKVKFLDANPNSTIIKDYKSEAYYNFFVGEQKFWRSEVYAYKKLTIKNLYPQIDLEILAQPDGIKLNFILGVGADPNKIKVQYDGADKLFLKNNQLHVQTSLGELLEESPFSFQMKDSVQEMIDTKYQLTNNILTYKLDRFNPKEPLVIDPAVVFGTYAGSAADNFGFAASFDNLGNAYGAGTVYAANFPYTAGAFDVSFNGGSSDNNEYARDAFIMKFNPNGSSLIFGTFIGGSDNEQPHSVTFYNNEIIVFGTTNSGNFPVTNNAFDKTYNGGSDLFVLKLNSAGSILNGSTFIGGTQDDGINGEAHFGFPAQTHSLPYNYADWYRGEVITDLVGNIYVSTCTRSNQSQGIPLINSAQTSYGGGFQDGYFVKLNNSLSNIIFSTFIGGSGNESAYSVCINNLNEPIIGGGTTSANLPFGSSNFPYSGDVDGFIAKYSSSGSLVRVIYTGTGFYDQIFFVQTDEQNNIYAMGQTKGNMPRTLGTYGVNNAKQFLQKYNSSLTSLLLSTTFGKPGGTEPSISPSAFLVDVCGRVYVSGWGGGTNTSYHNGMDNVFGLPTTSDAFQKSTDGSDFYLMALSPNFGTLLYATFYGGVQSQEHVDGGTSHFDKSGIVYQAVCAGCGGLDDFPTTSNAYSRINPGKRAYNTSIGGCNLGLFKFDMRTYILAPTFKDTVITIIAGSNLNYQFTANDAGGDNLTINFNSEVLNRTVNPAKITINGNSPGIINATLNWSTQCSDFGSDTIVIDVNVLDDACPLPNEVNGTIKIVLISEPIGPPYPDCIGVLNDSTLKLKWINGTPNSDFLNYQLYRKINDEPMVLFDSINNQLTTTYQDSKTPNILTTNYCYQILSLNSCRRAGDSSRVICSLYKEDSSTTNYFNGLEDDLIILHAFDTFSNSFIISDTDNKDSVFSKVTGSMVQLNKGNILTENGLGSAKTLLNWIPNCDDITGDTLELLIQVRDNTCPYFKQGNKLIKFLIIPAKQAISPNAYCPKKINNDSVLIEWPEFSALPLTKELRLYRKVNEKIELISSFSDLKTVSYLDVFTRNPSDLVCYALNTQDFCNYFGDTSNLSCLQNNSTPAPNLGIYTATVVDDKEIKLIWESANADSFWRYTVEKRVGRFGKNYEKIAEFVNIYDTVLTDIKVKVDEESYCYRIVNMDLCGNLSVNNKEACSILLQGNSIPFANQINWLPYDYWQNGINKYEVLKTEPGIYQDQLFATTFSKPLVKLDDQLNYDNGLYEYTILAHESTFGNNQTSQSNTIDLIQLPLLYAPNAYTENGDGLNDQFHTVPVFVKDYYLQIYNRWGERIFETHDKKQGFSSLYKGKEIKSEVYFYIVEYTGWDGNAYTKKGNFTLLR